MEPTPLTPQDPPTEAKAAPAPAPTALQSGAAHIDLGKILLPKKETPGQTPASAQRINAGILLEQEQQATLQPAAPKNIPEVPSMPEPKEEPSIKPIETYQRDIEDLVRDKNVSVLTIAAAEAERRGSQHMDSLPRVGASNLVLLKNISMYVLGFLLLAAASGALAYIVARPTSVSLPQPAAAPFITVDDTKVITILPSTPRSNVLSTLTAAKQATALALGLISQLSVTIASTTPNGQVLLPVDAQSFFTLIAPNVPQGLLLTLRPTYLLGVHVYNNNQPFLILSVDSYEQAYAGMLAWEPHMQQDLSPLFNYTPTVHIPEQGIATSTAPAPQFIQTGFVDKIVDNHDARVIQNSAGDITLLWTFLDRNTLVITTNDATLREVISRLKQAPVTPIPSGQ